MKKFSLRLEDELHEKVRVESFLTGASMNKIIVEAIEEKYKGDVGIKKEELEKSNKKKDNPIKYKIEGGIKK